VRDRFTVAEQMSYVMNAVRRDGTALFSSLCAELDRTGIIVTFLAILELIRRGRVGYDQPESFADIRLFAVAPAAAA